MIEGHFYYLEVCGSELAGLRRPVPALGTRDSLKWTRAFLPRSALLGMLRTTISLRLSLASTLLCRPYARISCSHPHRTHKYYSNTCTQAPTATPSRAFSTSLRNRSSEGQTPLKTTQKLTMRENIYTIPNVLTVSRILSCPILGWSILDGNYHLATGLLVYAGLSDLVCILSPFLLPSNQGSLNQRFLSTFLR